ncbi:MAG TPA: GGDEF domain-containing protein [Candidatus Hydrogenedentes bacterium]|nr:GGDEF domain-containing protein [Candidatus Hydrogenedentota bacterium]HRT21142.1 GGDEF domain-containing protein [Candidatus Hydrogenedentota bacterium]HRT64367.1 GGDEF domain-containing protein [Candidatus Hydrogenedentota bacterium]
MRMDDTAKTNLDDHTMLIGGADIRRAGTFRKAALVVLSGWEIGHEITLAEDSYVLGRGRQARVRIAAPSVSREHARIIRVSAEEGDEFEITDLGSSNGTFVNDEPVATSRLRHGDKIRMGDVLFKFVLQDEADARFYDDLRQLIHYDQLTGLLKMDAFKRELDAEIHRDGARRLLSLAMTDLDGLKKVNDTHGHLAGRMVVREMGAMIRHSIRKQDRAGLYGGDEAIIFFPETPLDEAIAVAEGLRTTIQQRTFDFHGATFRVSISQGLAEWPRHGETIEQLIHAADGALYAAKAAGRNCVRCAP